MASDETFNVHGVNKSNKLFKDISSLRTLQVTK